MSMNGPSPYAIRVLQAILHRPLRIPQIAEATRLAERTVQAQITALREYNAIKVYDRQTVRWGGQWARYLAVVERIAE